MARAKRVVYPSRLPDKWPASRKSDMQRDRVYDSENVVPTGGRLRTIEDMRRFVDSVVHSTWWKKRFPHVKDVAVGPTKAEDAEGDAIGHTGLGYVRFHHRRSMRSKRIGLHELSHVVIESSPVNRHTAIHGPLFCGVYLLLVRRFLGVSVSDRLERSFSRRNVEYESPDDIEWKWS